MREELELELWHGDYIARLAEAVLLFNSLEWDEKLFLQKDGCAIGTRAAPIYCGVFMVKLLRRVK